jgi:hypothetical protein
MNIQDWREAITAPRGLTDEYDDRMSADARFANEAQQLDALARMMILRLCAAPEPIRQFFLTMVTEATGQLVTWLGEKEVNSHGGGSTSDGDVASATDEVSVMEPTRSDGSRT